MCVTTTTTIYRQRCPVTTQESPPLPLSSQPSSFLIPGNHHLLSLSIIFKYNVFNCKCYGLNCVPRKRHSGVLTSRPQNITWFGGRVFTEVIKFKGGHYRSPNPYDWCPNEKGDMEKATTAQGWPVSRMTEIGTTRLGARLSADGWELTDRHRADLPPQPSDGTNPVDIWPPEPWDNTFLLVKPPSLGCFVTAALTNQYSMFM